MRTASTKGEPALRIAIPKGRVLAAVEPVLAGAGIRVPLDRPTDRRLVREDEDARLRFLVLRPDDVPTYVAYGVADIGIVGSDVLEERDRDDLYRPLDLGVGRCRIVVAAPRDGDVPAVPRVATRYPSITRAAFARRGAPVEVIPLSGAVELAPAAGLAHLVVDIADTGRTLRQNGLVEREVLLPVSTVVVVNRVGLKLDRARIVPLLSRLESSARKLRRRAG